MPGNGAYQVPHSSTTRATFLAGSYLSMIALCLVISSSITKVRDKVWIHAASSNVVDDARGGQPPGMV